MNEYLDNKISIVIPVYNVEDYIERCLDSVINQTYRNVEIILIDDGSTDNSGKICDEYAELDNRITVIHKENGGLSDARNVGIRASTGDYIGFVDSDDYIKTDMYEVLYNNLKIHNADIAECGYSVCNNKQNNINIIDSCKVTQFDSFNALKELILSRQLKTIAWNKLYRKTVIENNFFPVNKFNEDVSWTYKVFSIAEKIIRIDYSGYFYCYRKNSIRISLEYLNKKDWFFAYKERLEFIKKKYNTLYNLAEKLFLIHLVKEYRNINTRNYLDNDKSSRLLITKYINDNYKFLLKNPLIGIKLILLIRIFRISPFIGSNLLYFRKELNFYGLTPIGFTASGFACPPSAGRLHLQAYACSISGGIKFWK
jgi:glycosyltransferase involved in cell wall biosynthesis